MTRILIADDHAIVRAGLKQIVADSQGMVVAGEAETGQKAIDLVCKRDFDIVLLDIAMPGRSGFDTLKQIRNENPELPVLILSMYPEEQYAVRALKTGAAGYLNKGSAPDELITAIKKIATGGKYVSPKLAEMLVSEMGAGNYELQHDALSNREFEVMCMIASGKTVKQVAEELCLSIKTISTYRGRILQKMHMETSAELTHYAIKNHLVW